MHNFKIDTKNNLNLMMGFFQHKKNGARDFSYKIFFFNYFSVFSLKS